jgi:hypothetical protein
MGKTMGGEIMTKVNMTKLNKEIEKSIGGGVKCRGFVVAALLENDEIAIGYHKLDFVQRVGLSSTLNFDMNYLPNKES